MAKGWQLLMIDKKCEIKMSAKFPESAAVPRADNMLFFFKVDYLLLYNFDFRDNLANADIKFRSTTLDFDLSPVKFSETEADSHPTRIGFTCVERKDGNIIQAGAAHFGNDLSLGFFPVFVYQDGGTQKSAGIWMNRLDSDEANSLEPFYSVDRVIGVRDSTTEVFIGVGVPRFIDYSPFGLGSSQGIAYFKVTINDFESGKNFQTNDCAMISVQIVDVHIPPLSSFFFMPLIVIRQTPFSRLIGKYASNSDAMDDMGDQANSLVEILIADVYCFAGNI